MVNMKICKFRYADWCHCPPIDENENYQEKCPYYEVNHDESECSAFEEQTNGLINK